MQVPYDRRCKHEFVLSGRRLKAHGVRTLDIAKGLIDRGSTPHHLLPAHRAAKPSWSSPPRPSRGPTLDASIEKMRLVVEEASTDASLLTEAPVTMPVRRLDEVRAARQPVVRQRFEDDEAAAAGEGGATVRP